MGLMNFWGKWGLFYKKRKTIFTLAFIFRDLSYGKGNTAPVKGTELPKINKIEPWDGKDGVLPEEEDIDLSDVDLDEKDEL